MGGGGGPPGALGADGSARLADADKKSEAKAEKGRRQAGEQEGAQPPPPPPGGQEPVVRKNFADTAYWNPTLVTDKGGMAEIGLTMPENLTGWKVKAWAMGHGTKVGEGSAEVVTKKDLLVRLQAPRFFVQKDEVVLSANVHNYLKADKQVRVGLEMDGGTLLALDPLVQNVTIAAGGEKRVDWRVRVVNEGDAIVRMKAQTDAD